MPAINHQTVKRILRYLAHTPTLGLWYPKGAQFDLVRYSDSDYASDLVDSKSTSGTCHFLCRSLVCWSSRKKNCVSLSTAEAKYIVVGACCTQLLWMKQTLKDYGIKVKHIIVTMGVLSKLHITLWSILARSILPSDIISFAIMLLERISLSIVTRPKTILLIFSPSLLTRNNSMRYGVS